MTRRQLYSGMAAMLACGVIFVLPFLFVFLTAAKTRQEAQAADLHMARRMAALAKLHGCDRKPATTCSSWSLQLGSHHRGRGDAARFCSAAMVGYVVQRRPSRWNTVIYAFVLAA